MGITLTAGHRCAGQAEGVDEERDGRAGRQGTGPPRPPQKALGGVAGAFAGQAQAYGKTSAGAQDRFRVASKTFVRRSARSCCRSSLGHDKAADFVNQMQDGTGAGGRFAAKLKDIADRMRPIVKFFTDHPKIIAVAIAAWVAYRVAAAAAMAATRLKALGMFKGLARPAAVAGTESGAAFGSAASTTTGAGAMRRGRWGNVGNFIGGALGKAAGAAMVVGLGLALRDSPQVPALNQYSGGKGWGELFRDIKDDVLLARPAKRSAPRSEPRTAAPSRHTGRLRAWGVAVGGVKGAGQPAARAHLERHGARQPQPHRLCGRRTSVRAAPRSSIRLRQRPTASTLRTFHTRGAAATPAASPPAAR
jgi:hypothetical protein